MSPYNRIQRWPMDIPKRLREPHDGGPQVCGFRRVPSDPETGALTACPVRLDRHLLVLVIRGGVWIEKNGHQRVINEGSAGLILPGEIRLTEFSTVPGAGVDVVYYMFTTRFVRNRFLNCEDADIMAHRVFPAFSEIYLLENFIGQLLPAMSGANFQFPFHFSKLLNFVFSGCWAGSFMFLKHPFFEKKRALDIFLEGHVLSPLAEYGAETAYPGGAAALNRNCRLFTGMTPGGWLLKRRMELARVWLRYGDKPVEYVARTLGYTGREKFRQHYRRIYRRTPEREPWVGGLLSMSPAHFNYLTTPFWFASEEKEPQKFDLATFEAFEEFYCLSEPRPTQAAKEAPLSIPDEKPELPDTTHPRFAFYECTSTGVEGIIPFPKNADLGQLVA